MPSLRLCFYFIQFSATLPKLPNSLSVQRQGTGSRHWLDFHTIPSTERHINSIRANKCGGALVSRAPISLARPGSAHTDGLVISDQGAEGTDEHEGTLRSLWVGHTVNAMVHDKVCETVGSIFQGYISRNSKLA